jgi:thiamine pyrophosphate-dependent acetolactate synthase large subunit-like protein
MGAEGLEESNKIKNIGQSLSELLERLKTKSENEEIEKAKYFPFTEILNENVLFSDEDDPTGERMRKPTEKEINDYSSDRKKAVETLNELLPDGVILSDNGTNYFPLKISAKIDGHSFESGIGDSIEEALQNFLTQFYERLDED